MHLMQGNGNYDRYECSRFGSHLPLPTLQTNSCSSKHHLWRVYRAHFSAINPSDIIRAYNALGKPDRCHSMSVDARQELDLKGKSRGFLWSYLTSVTAEHVLLLFLIQLELPSLGFRRDTSKGDTGISIVQCCHMDHVSKSISLIVVCDISSSTDS